MVGISAQASDPFSHHSINSKGDVLPQLAMVHEESRQFAYGFSILLHTGLGSLLVKVSKPTLCRA